LPQVAAAEGVQAYQYGLLMTEGIEWGSWTACLCVHHVIRSRECQWAARFISTQKHAVALHQ
jgi:hypothetical protein